MGCSYSHKVFSISKSFPMSPTDWGGGGGGVDNRLPQAVEGTD